MADISNSYVSLIELKAWVNVTSQDHDTLLSTCAVVAASQIDNYCGRRFYAAAASASARSFVTSPDGKYLFTDDFTELTSVTVDGTTVACAADIAPYGRPYAAIRASDGAYFLIGRTAVVTAKFGWTAQPEIIGTANLMLAARIFERRLSPFGIQGSPDIGLIRVTGEDRDVTALIGPYRKLAGMCA